ncbi:hypothetical protein FB45DRAFT_1065766 [Roridomyces roridus]|uniref:Uncharacterized protein n=1 Tax=Roridomyces roridus TaxID=1738132 RepID=A0AAD7FA71_9AGAR|nr:hypothetical protein FB45DRAFT_1065766 [Roridomyces roridus]
MSVPADRLLEAAGRAWSLQTRVSSDDMRHKLEWAWGLPHGTFYNHVNAYTGPAIVDLIMNDDLILIPHPELVLKLHVVAASMPWGFSSTRRVAIQDVYQGCQNFEYLVLPLEASSTVPPRAVFSPIPPHLTISCCVDKILRRGGYAVTVFDGIRDSLISHARDKSVSGATFVLNKSAFAGLTFIHGSWADASVPRRFLGLDEDSDGDSGSSTMEWEAQTPPAETKQRLFPHELKQDPVLKFWAPVADDDDAVSWDSHITGVEPEQLAQASIAKGDYSSDEAWLKGVESWVESTAGALENEELIPAKPIEDNSDEQPRAIASLDLEKPDFIRVRRQVQAVLPRTA